MRLNFATMGESQGVGTGPAGFALTGEAGLAGTGGATAFAGIDPSDGGEGLAGAVFASD